MKHLKLFGLSAIAAFSLIMAFVGAGTASATVLCTTSDTPCTMSYLAGTSIVLSLQSGSTARLTSGSSTIATCTGGEISGATINSGGVNTPVNENTSSVTWTGCNQTTDTVANGQLVFEYTFFHEALVRGIGPQLTIVIFGVSCTYSLTTGADLGYIIGGSAPILRIKEAPTHKVAGGFLCPETVTWDAEYVITEPHTLFFSES